MELNPSATEGRGSLIVATRPQRELFKGREKEKKKFIFEMGNMVNRKKAAPRKKRRGRKKGGPHRIPCWVGEKKPSPMGH